MLLDTYLISDIGLNPNRRRNEDRCGAFMPEDSDLRAERGRLFVVADGMGGHPDGDIAAELAVRAIPEGFFQGGWSNAAAKLYDAMQQANSEILSYAGEHPASRGMGATSVCMAVTETETVIAHIGDCRAYRVRGGRVERLTSDHSWVEERVAAGGIRAEDAPHHPYRNMVTRALGMDLEIEPAVRAVDAAAGDVYVLCSDGLWGVVDEFEIGEIAAVNRDARSLARALVDRALEHGGPDNIAVVVVRFVVDGETTLTRTRPSLVATTIKLRRDGTSSLN